MDRSTELAAALHEVPGVTVRSGVSGKTLTTFAIGGELNCLIEVSEIEALLKVRQVLTTRRLRSRVLGAGSNLLIPDDGVIEPVLRLGERFRAIYPLEGGRFRIGGGASLMTTSRAFSEGGWSGFEFAGGIPASVGGALFMNAGAHGGSIGERVVEVEVSLPDGSLVRLDPRELQFEYRHALLPEGAVVTEITVQLTQSDPITSSQVRAENLAARKRTQPLSKPSAGSVFRNPTPERPAGRVLEEAGMKGAAEGGAQVSELHANWIINPTRSATAADVRVLIERCQKAALERCGISLRPEVVVW